MKKEDIRIVFMGTPEFAVASLKAILLEGYKVVGVITAPDKPAGRGRKLSYSAIKSFALEKELKILQPNNLKDNSFLDELKKIKANLQVVVAFRMLPMAVWAMPELGTFNLHASLLPQYRGAAPINHAIINGEKKTGLTTFLLDEKIDTGRIIKQVDTYIGENETAGELHDRLMILGAELVVNTIKQIKAGRIDPVSQDTIQNGKLKPAPKIFKEYCKIDWESSTDKLFDFIRGLSPYPAAFTSLSTNNGNYQLKIFYVKKGLPSSDGIPGQIETDNKSFLRVKTGNGWLNILELQMQGKKKMDTINFLNGFKIPADAKFVSS